MSVKLAISRISRATENLENETFDDDCEVFKEIVRSFKEKFPMWDLSHMHLIVSPTPRNQLRYEQGPRVLRN